MQPQHRSIEDITHERESLAELLKSDGWKFFVNRVHEEWQGAGYYTRMGAALKDPDPSNAKVIHRTSIEVVGMLTWPASRVSYLAKGKAE